MDDLTYQHSDFIHILRFYAFILECHESCDGGCHDGSPKGCESCKDGWEESEEDGCVDKDECTGDVCESNKYCVNTPGSFKCEGITEFDALNSLLFAILRKC